MTWLCDDCSVNTWWEFYAVKHELWPSDANMLCIGCLEARIGRLLTANDFPELPINSLDDSNPETRRFSCKSRRLKARLALR
jgi:hypothetical protein